MGALYRIVTEVEELVRLLVPMVVDELPVIKPDHALSVRLRWHSQAQAIDGPS